MLVELIEPLAGDADLKLCARDLSCHLTRLNNEFANLIAKGNN